MKLEILPKNLKYSRFRSNFIPSTAVSDISLFSVLKNSLSDFMRLWSYIGYKTRGFIIRSSGGGGSGEFIMPCHSLVSGSQLQPLRCSGRELMMSIEHIRLKVLGTTTRCYWCWSCTLLNWSDNNRYMTLHIEGCYIVQELSRSSIPCWHKEQ